MNIAFTRRVEVRFTFLAICGVLFQWNGFVSAAEKPARPNILIILADDLGFSDLGCYGSEIRTKNLDALAANGLRFTQFYNCARCCPSRASLLTGLYPHQAGIGLMTSNRPPQAAGDKEDPFPGYRGALNSHCVTIAQVLKAAGYRTAAAGKWHVGDSISPTTRGFDDFYGFVGGYAVDSWDSRMMTRLPQGRPQRSYAPGEFFATDAITDQALDMLAEMRKEPAPWFMYLAYQAPHFPIQSKPGDMAGYPEIYAQGWDSIREQRLAKQKSLGVVAGTTQLTPRSRIPNPGAAKRIGSMTDDGDNPAWNSLPADRRADLAQRMAVYAGMVTGLDRNVGRMIEDLRANGQLDNTLIFFMSDNGACAEWEPYGFELPAPHNPRTGFGIDGGTEGRPNKLYSGDELGRMGGPTSLPSLGSAWANACNTPWRMYKHFTHEGGISSPFIVHWPAAIKAKNELREQPGHLIDIMATCIDVAGANYPTDVDGSKIFAPEGRSLAPAFSNQPIQRDFIAWEHEHNRGIRMENWKLVSIGKGPWELYDMNADRTELSNLASSQPQRVKDMSEVWDAWAKRTQVLPRPGGASRGSQAD